MPIPIKRIVSRKFDMRDTYGKQIVVMLEPGGTIAMREAGKRTVYRGSLEKVYWVLAKWHALDQIQQKKLAKKLKKETKDDWRRRTFENTGDEL